MAQFSYGYFGAQSRFPNGVASVTLYLTVGGATKGIAAPIFVDDTITVPELHWLAGGSLAPRVRYILFPPGEMYPSPLRLTAERWPMAGEVVKLPGLGIKAASVSMPISMPQPAPAPVAAPVAAPMPSLPPAPPSTPAPSSTPAPVAQAVNTGQVTAVDVPGAGKVDLPVYVAPIAQAEIVPGPGGGLVVVVPKDQISNLPTRPVRVMPTGVPGDTAPLSYSAEMWNTYFNFPPTGRLPLNTQPVVDVTAAARGSAQEAPVDVRDLTVTSAGVFDREGRPYPTTQPLRTLPTEAPSASGLMPTTPGRVTVLDATVQTDGTLLEQGRDLEARAHAARKDAAAREAAAAAGGSLLPLVAGAGAGFLVAGPVGAGVGAIIGFVIAPGKAAK
jgi:hypothetical protein